MSLFDAGSDVIESNSPVFEFVDSDGHVSRLVGAAVDVSVVLGQKVDVVEDVARVVGLFTRLRVADVHQHRSVEPGRQSLGRSSKINVRVMFVIMFSKSIYTNQK